MQHENYTVFDIPGAAEHINYMVFAAEQLSELHGVRNPGAAEHANYMVSTIPGAAEHINHTVFASQGLQSM